MPAEDLLESTAERLSIEVAGPPDAARARIISELNSRLTWEREAFHSE